MTTKQRDKLLDSLALELAFHVPFFIPGAMKLPIVWDEGCKTACTNGKEILWNPQRFDEWASENERILNTIRAEEICHCILGHLWRAPSGADWDTWNAACDQEVRWMLKEFSDAVKAQGKAEPFPFPKDGRFNPTDVYRGMAAEKVYGIMMANKAKQGGGGQPKPNQQPGQQPGQQQGQQQGQGNQPGKGNTPGKGQGKGKGQGNAPGQGSGQPGQPGQPAQGGGGQEEIDPLGGMVKPGTSDEEQKEADKRKTDWQRAAIQATKGRGHIPGSIARLVQDITQPKTAPIEVIKSWIREQASEDWDFLKPALEWEGSGFILPSLNSDRCGEVVFATDTSGSIDDAALATFQQAKQYALDFLKPKKLVDIYCDSAIHKVEEYVPGQEIGKDSPGGGGTSFVPVFDWVDANLPKKPKCLVYLTDLDGAFPSVPPDYPVLWVTWVPKKEGPFGMTVEIEH